MPWLPILTARTNAAYSSGFYSDADFDYTVRILLGRCAYGAADAGEVMATIASVADKDHDHWFHAWNELGVRLREIADSAAAGGHAESAAQAYLRAATYAAVAIDAASALGSDELLLKTFRAHRADWERFVDTVDRPVERVAIPYEGTTMPGYFFRAGSDASPCPTLVMVNGSDGAISGLWASGAAAALDRGYHVLVFDGPGQQSMLFEHGIGFRPDWDAVLTPVVDFLLERPDVDGDRLALYGVSQGGYWIAQALTKEHRFAAAIADPGVVDVASSWRGNIPGSLLETFEAGKKRRFDRYMFWGMKASSQTNRTWTFRARPYRQSSYFDTLTEVHRYTLTATDAAHITTPLFITDPENEQFWPGQSQRLATITGGPSHLCKFTAAEGASFHCQPMALRLTHQRMFDWLDDQLSTR
ncbi:alpha/beta fold hydrolase [Nocardia sp. NPDC005978]|uniref:alpha/beta hydrolase family protein n=1 Tax=Nocardia sp. NPDC005978 TaxID=3156725 RepID=UPI0033A15429